MAWLELTEGDTRPSRIRLTVNKQPLPLDGAAVTLVMKPARGMVAPPLRRGCVIVDADSGIIDVPWQPGDLDEGLSYAKFEILDANAHLFHVPGGQDWLDVIVGAAA